MSDFNVVSKIVEGDVNDIAKVLMDKFSSENELVIEGLCFKHKPASKKVNIALNFNLYSCDLTKIPFQDVYFGFHFNRCKIISCKFEDSDFGSASWQFTNLLNSSIKRTSFKEYSFSLCSFKDTKMERCSFEDCEFCGCIFDGSKMEKINFSDCVFTNVTFRCLTKANITFSNCKFESSKFELEKTIFEDINFINCQQSQF